MSAYVQSARNERMVRILGWINDHDEGEGIRISVRQLAEVLELRVATVVAHLKWLKAFGAVRAYVEQPLGVGRVPNRYVPVYTVEEWLEVGPKIATELRLRMNGRTGPPPRKARPLVVVPEMAAAQLELQETATANLEPLEPHVAAPLEDDEVDAWGLLR